MFTSHRSDMLTSIWSWKAIVVIQSGREMWNSWHLMSENEKASETTFIPSWDTKSFHLSCFLWLWNPPHFILRKTVLKNYPGFMYLSQVVIPLSEDMVLQQHYQSIVKKKNKVERKCIHWMLTVNKGFIECKLLITCRPVVSLSWWGVHLSLTT